MASTGTADQLQTSTYSALPLRDNKDLWCKGWSNNNSTDDALLLFQVGDNVPTSNDENSHAYAEETQPVVWRAPADKCVKSLTIEVQWKDQGWGNQKGSIGYRVVRDDAKDGETVVTEEWVSQKAGHSNSKCSKTFDLSSSKALQSVLAGDRLDVLARVGGGGGHRLEIFWAEVTLEWINPEAPM